MASGDLDPLEEQLLATIGQLSPESPSSIDPELAWTLFRAQATSRILDHTARRLRADGIGYYTIGSAGHESNAAVSLALRVTDPALLHYRSGGFYVARAMRAAQLGLTDLSDDGVDDMLRGMLAKATEPIAGGRHKVFGRADLNVIPQTSTIASHLPRAVGLAVSLGNSAAEHEGPWPRDSVVVCSFGDASLNHSTAQGALNWAANARHRGQRVPILFVCEDNGLGISVPTPRGWVESVAERFVEFGHAQVDGSQPAQVMAATAELVERARSDGQPAFLHLRTVRFLAHAGSDVESAYRAPAAVRSDVARDPIVGAAQLVVSTAAKNPAELVDWYHERQAQIEERAEQIREEPELLTADEVMRPLARSDRRPPTRIAGPATNEPMTVAQSINTALTSILNEVSEALVFGEDVGRKGGVYGVTRGLQKQFGARRIFDTILDEQSILGLALGASLNGFLALPEIQYLAYLHNAEDQIRGEAATLQFFSQRQYANPMVVRIAGYGYQRGFGGHFHNDNSVAVLRDIPGLIIASPAHPSDAGPMLIACAEAALADGSVSAFIEPIARYHTTDLLEDGDGGWLGVPLASADIGRARTHGDGRDLTILTFGNGVYLSMQAQHRLAANGIDARVVDLRWIAPLPIEDMLREAEASGRVLIVDETRRTGGVGEGILAELIDAGFQGAVRRIAAQDSFVPLGEAANLVLVQVDDIVDAATAVASSG